MLVIQQRSSRIVIPDVLLAQRVWGGEKSQWPENWRNNLATKVGGGSPVKCQRACPPECPMHNSPVRHGHFRYKITSIEDCQHRDQTFLGALETFGYLDEQSDWRYDFSEPRGTADEVRRLQEQISEDRKAGRLVSVYLPLLLFGPAKRMKLPYEQRQLLLALTRELTRADRSSRPDKALIMEGRQKSIGQEGTRVGVYPQLQPGHSYVTFGGNASHHRSRLRGRGYYLLGRGKGGWLHRAGYSIPADKKGHWKAVVEFLKDLDALSSRFGLAVAGWNPDKKQWKSLSDMRAIVHHRDGKKWLDRCLLRVYTHADYLTRWRQHFADQMGFTAIPGGQEDEPVVVVQEQPVTVISSALELDQWMKQKKLTNEELAEKLKCTKSWVGHQRSGRREWSKEFEKKLKEYQDTIDIDDMGR